MFVYKILDIKPNPNVLDPFLIVCNCMYLAELAFNTLTLNYFYYREKILI